MAKSNHSYIGQRFRHELACDLSAAVGIFRSETAYMLQLKLKLFVALAIDSSAQYISKSMALYLIDNLYRVLRVNNKRNSKWVSLRPGGSIDIYQLVAPPFVLFQ